ncbi:MULTISPECIES: GntR family transcriptional regulator [Corynebacterium]|uniref:GntR family transcriptional regulator n=1 Tax=Corynebacterium TaxID=1716 RepID=UPI00124D4C0D|nr:MULTISPECIES: GntR family transcriptional regulator [Corynebacterium]
MSEVEGFGGEEGQSWSTYKAWVETHIRLLLLQGSMEVGQIYSANAMAKELQMSNSPVREAMMSLVERGLLELVRNRGFRVVRLGSTDVWEIYQLRRLLEVEAVRTVAAARLTSEQVANIGEYATHTDELSTGASSEGMFDYFEADHHFHLYLVSLTGNQRWVELLGRLRDQCRVNGLHAHAPHYGSTAAAPARHIDIADAVITRDVRRAVQAMEAHLDYLRMVAEENI